ncbi:MAG: hypothetical protein K4571_08445 [Deltaproteobacteria bacterium]
MKIKFYLPVILSLTGIISFSSLCFSEPPNPKLWEPLGYHSYYNKKIIRQSPDLPLVWTYKTITDEARAARVAEVKAYDPEKSMTYQNYHHEAVLWEVDCRNQRLTMKEFIDFDKQGAVLDRYRYDKSQWESIIPQSGGDRLYQNVCTTRKMPAKKKKK